MRDLEQRSHAKDFSQVGTNASEHIVVEEDIALDLLGEALDGSGVGQAEFCPTLGERVDGISDRVGKRVREDRGPDRIQCSDGRHDGRGD